jgi:pentatricopeptide repeat protein
MGKQGMVDESIALYEEMYNASVRMGLQILCQALSRLGVSASSPAVI